MGQTHKAKAGILENPNYKLIKREQEPQSDLTDIRAFVIQQFNTAKAEGNVALAIACANAAATINLSLQSD